LEANSLNASFAFNAIATSGTALAFQANLTSLTFAALSAVNVSSFAPCDGVAIKVDRTGAGEVVIGHGAECIRTTDILDLAWVFTPILNASLARQAFSIVSAANVAVAFRDTGLIRGAAVVHNASLHAEIIDTSLTTGALSVDCAYKTTLTIHTFLTIATVWIGLAHS